MVRNQLPAQVVKDRFPSKYRLSVRVHQIKEIFRSSSPGRTIYFHDTVIHISRLLFISQFRSGNRDAKCQSPMSWVSMHPPRGKMGDFGYQRNWVELIHDFFPVNEICTLHGPLKRLWIHSWTTHTRDIDLRTSCLGVAPGILNKRIIFVTFSPRRENVVEHVLYHPASMHFVMVRLRYFVTLFKPSTIF